MNDPRLLFVLALAAVGAAGAGCNRPCNHVAELLRACCARGPSDRVAGCENVAAQLEDDGNQSACSGALERGTYDRCEP